MTVHLCRVNRRGRGYEKLHSVPVRERRRNRHDRPGEGGGPQIPVRFFRPRHGPAVEANHIRAGQIDAVTLGEVHNASCWPPRCKREDHSTVRQIRQRQDGSLRNLVARWGSERAIPVRNDQTSRGGRLQLRKSQGRACPGSCLFRVPGAAHCGRGLPALGHGHLRQLRPH